jgi:voltage-gated potassium channel
MFPLMVEFGRIRGQCSDGTTESCLWGPIRYRGGITVFGESLTNERLDPSARYSLRPNQRLILSISIVVSVYVLGTIGYAVLEECSLFDAAYMTTITLSTVGFGEHIALDDAGRIWTMTVITLGIAGVSFALTSAVSTFVSGDIGEVLGRKKLESAISKLKNHIILCGYGRMGELTTEKLRRENRPIVVIERSPDQCERLKDQDVLFVHGDATEEEILMKAGLMDCIALVAALPTDVDNLYTTLTARGLRPDLKIVARAEQPSAIDKLTRAGATHVICPQSVGALKTVNLLTRPNVVQIFEVADRGVDLEMDEFVVEARSPLCNCALRDSPIRDSARATVIAIKPLDEKPIYQPMPDHIIRQGDTLILIGESGVATRLGGLSK